MSWKSWIEKLKKRFDDRVKTLKKRFDDWVETPPDPPPQPPTDPDTPPPPPPPPPPTIPKSGLDDLDLSTVTNMIIHNSPGLTVQKLLRANISASITMAKTNGKNLYTSYGKYSWPVSEDGVVDAIAYFFYEKDGAVKGGKFDWWRRGGQGTKGLINVHEGYGGHHMPASGTKCWTMISSIDGSQRSNTCIVTWQ